MEQKRIKKFIVEYWPMAALVLIFSFIYRQWFSFDIFVSGDMWYQYPETLQSYLKFSTWHNLGLLGVVNISLWELPFMFIYGIFGALGLPSNIAEKFVLYFPFAIVTPLASFALVKYIVRDNLGAFAGALVFSLNTYYLAINTQGHFNLSVAATFSVLGILFLMKAIDKKEKSFLIGSAILFFISGSYDFRVFYMTFFVISGYITQKFIFRGQRDWKNFFRYSGVIFLLLVILNIFWILPMIKGGALTENSAVSRDLVANNYYLNILKPLTLFHPFWTGNSPEWFESQSIPVWFWITPIVAFLGWWLNRKNREVSLFGIVALVGIFLSKQADLPFDDFYGWLHRHFPGFNAFREASKFYFLVALGYGVLIGSFLASIHGVWKKKDGLSYTLFKKRYLAHILTVLIVGIFLWNAKPIVIGTIGDMFMSKQISADELAIYDLVSKDKQFYRTLWFPSESRFAFYSATHPKINAMDMGDSDWQDFIISEERRNNPSRNGRAESLFEHSFSGQIMGVSSIKYLFTNTGKGINHDIFSSLGFRQINIGTESIFAYENLNYRPHIYLTEKRETIYRDVPFRQVDFQSISPAQYEVELKNIKDPFFLNFSDRFHPDWKLRAGDFNWWDAIFQKDYFLSDKDHFENDAKLNSFYINPEKACSKYECQKNPDGGYDMKLTLFFKAQGWFYLGLIISGATLVLCFLYLAYAIIKKWKK